MKFKSCFKFLLKSSLIFLFLSILFSCSNVYQESDADFVEFDLSGIVEQANSKQIARAAVDSPAPITYIRAEFSSKRCPSLNQTTDLLQYNASPMKIKLGKIRRNIKFDLTVIVDIGTIEQHQLQDYPPIYENKFKIESTYKGEMSTMLRKYISIVDLNVSPINRYQVGDIVFIDGTKMSNDAFYDKYGEFSSLTEDEKEAAKDKVVGVIFRPGLEGSALGIGKVNLDDCAWANNGNDNPNNKADGYSRKIDSLKATFEEDGFGYKVSGNSDGKNSLSKLLSSVSENIDVNEESGISELGDKYPAFHGVHTYSQNADLQGTKYETGWWLPTVYEAKEILDNWSNLVTSFTSISGDFGEASYWTCAQDGSNGDNSEKKAIRFSHTDASKFEIVDKGDNAQILAVHVF